MVANCCWLPAQNTIPQRVSESNSCAPQWLLQITKHPLLNVSFTTVPQLSYKFGKIKISFCVKILRFSELLRTPAKIIFVKLLDLIVFIIFFHSLLSPTRKTILILQFLYTLKNILVLSCQV